LRLPEDWPLVSPFQESFDYFDLMDYTTSKQNGKRFVGFDGLWSLPIFIICALKGMTISTSFRPSGNGSSFLFMRLNGGTGFQTNNNKGEPW
jgi:hypothetical protein